MYNKGRRDLHKISNSTGKISCSHGGEYEDDSLLGYCAVQSGTHLPTFNRSDDGGIKHT
jgi:hypothetical protein